MKTGKKKSTVWGKEQDNKLRQLFDEPASRGGIDPKDKTKATLEKFRQVFRRKSQHYLLGKELAGKRKAAAVKATNSK